MSIFTAEIKKYQGSTLCNPASGPMHCIICINDYFPVKNVSRYLIEKTCLPFCR